MDKKEIKALIDKSVKDYFEISHNPLDKTPFWRKMLSAFKRMSTAHNKTQDFLKKHDEDVIKKLNAMFYEVQALRTNILAMFNYFKENDEFFEEGIKNNIEFVLEESKKALVRIQEAAEEEAAEEGAEKGKIIQLEGV